MALARAAATSGGLLQEVSCSSQQLHQYTGESVLIVGLTYCNTPPSCAQEGFRPRWLQGLLTVQWIFCVWMDGNGMLLHDDLHNCTFQRLPKAACTAAARYTAR